MLCARLGWLACALLCACGGSSSPGMPAADSGGTDGGGANAGQGGRAVAGATSAADGGGAGSAGLPLGAAGGAAATGPCWKRPLSPPDMPWNQRIDGAPKDAESDVIIAALQTRGWGAGRLQIDFSIDVLCADASTPLRAFQKTDSFYDGECDDAPVPVPAGGHVEGESGYACTGGGDCHLIVIDAARVHLYEQWMANIDAQNNFSGGCLALWDLTREYDATLRGDQCSSADAAGLPIAPLLFDADEVAAGEIDHAVRFALPNTHLRNRTYVRPATHATAAASAGADGVPYGARLRLRADYPVDSLPSAGARVLARALQRYGMILADGGNIALMGQDDRSTQHKWADVLGPRDLAAIAPMDFEMVEAGQRFTWQGDCVLNQ